MGLIQSPLGPLRLHFEGDALISLDLLMSPQLAQEALSAPEQRLASELADYFRDPYCCFQTPLRLLGSQFQQRVWQALRQIPCGEVRSYGQLAQQLGSSPRAVGNACRANPCPILVPCHRVVAAAGLGGYSGASSGPQLEIKRWLLRHEGVVRG